MAYHDVQFPNYDDYTTQAGPGQSANVLRMDSGQRRAVVRWPLMQHRYDVAHRVRGYDRIAEIKNFWMARNGIEHSFGYFDHADHTSTASGMDNEANPDPVSSTDQQIGVGDGVTTTFQLVKRYADGAGSAVRKITKPIAGTVVTSLDDVNQSSGWTVNTLTGLVTFTSAPSLGVVVKAGFKFLVPVTFGEAVSDWFAASLDSANSGSIPSLPLVEDLDGTECSEDLHFGGAKSVSFSSNITIDLSAGVWGLSPTTIELKVILPALSTVPKGGPIFVLQNLSGTRSLFVVKDDGTTAVVTINPSSTVELIHGLDASGVSQWIVLEY